MNAQLVGLDKIIMHLKMLSQTHPNKTELSIQNQLKYQRIQNIAGRMRRRYFLTNCKSSPITSASEFIRKLCRLN